jgi:Tol biopolymer transport system component
VTFALSPPPGTRFTDSSRDPGTVSPDGQSVVFSATDIPTGVSQLWLHSLGSMKSTPIPESAGAVQTFWSPDSRAVAFFTAQGLKRLSVGGVRSDTVAAAAEPRGGTWSRDGTILFAQGPRSGLYRVAVTGEAARPVLVMAPDTASGELGYVWPQFLADGRQFIYFVLSNDDNVRGIYLSSPDGGKGRRLVASDASGIAVDGRLLFVRDGNLAIQRFDPRRAAVEGDARTLLSRVATTFDGRSVVAASGQGTLAYSPAQYTQLSWYDGTGRLIETLALPPARYRSPVVSRDGRYVAVQRYRDALGEIVIFDLARGALATVVRGESGRPAQSPDVQCAVWGPDRRLAFASAEGGWLDIYAKNVDDDRPAQLLYSSPTDKIPTDWSPDGRSITFMELSPSGNYDLWILPAEGGREPFPLLAGPHGEGSGRFSPDGRRLAYVSNESGQVEVWLRSLEGAQGGLRLSLEGGIDPGWVSKSEVSFMDRAGRLIVARVPVGARAAEVRALFPTRVVTPLASRNNYDWAPDGRRVLVNEPDAQGAENRSIVVLNWNALAVE